MSPARTRRSARARLGAGAALLALAATALGGCVTPMAGADGLYARPLGSAPVTPNPTPYSAALSCVAAYAAQHNLAAPRIAVGRLSDLTGRLDENGGRTVTQGASLMAMSALGKAGVPLVERYETDVSKLEYQLADNKLIAADQSDPRNRRDYRAIFPGEMSGSQYFLTGGITELNTNIRGQQAGAKADKADGAVRVATLAGDVYVMNVGVDLRLVDTRSLDVVKLVSYQKQIIGHRLNGELFSFFGGNVVSISGESGGDEPVHLAVRSLIERAVLEMVAGLYRLPSPDACLGGQDPLRPTIVSEPGVQPWAPPAPTYARASKRPHAAPPRVAYAPPPQGAYGAPPPYAPAYAPPPRAPLVQPYLRPAAPHLPPPAYAGRY